MVKVNPKHFIQLKLSSFVHKEIRETTKYGAIEAGRKATTKPINTFFLVYLFYELKAVLLVAAAFSYFGSYVYRVDDMEDALANTIGY